jgi:demethylmenaquinone methyltransferase/2-methoxy-6-polyprenyl-1,4-benzoquinol methylase
MFGRIVARYDLMNRVMTFGLDVGWRRAAIEALNPADSVVLDIGTGTGDLALAAARAGARRVVGVDFVAEMVASAQEKVTVAGQSKLVSFAVGDAMILPFADESFDGIVNGFLLRNVADLDATFRELFRVLKPGGRLVCLEITHPPRALAPFFGLYFGRIVPLLGAVLTKESAAYRYLPESLAPLPAPDRLASMLHNVGLEQVHYRRLGMGTVALHVGQRPERP